jgi:NAD(P)H dehydrogenase (quinone)
MLLGMYTITGATGKLGRLVVEDLLNRGVNASDIVVAVRNPEKATDLAARGVEVREADYDRPETLVAAFKGSDKLLLISANEFGQRLRQHRNVIDAAVAAGVGQIIYTSILNADSSGIAIADDHKATEAEIRASGLPYVFLRNSWYLENYTGNLGSALEHGVILGSTAGGRVAAATRADYAAAAAAVLTTDGHTNRAYELGGDEPFTMAELAAVVARQTGKPVSYQDLPEPDYAQALTGFGVPEGYAKLLADSDVGIGRGELTTSTGDLSRLIGRPTTTVKQAVTQAL